MNNPKKKKLPVRSNERAATAKLKAEYKSIMENTAPSTTRSDEILLEDCDDVSQELSNETISAPFKTTSISFSLSQDLRRLLIGEKNRFIPAWLHQGFCFRPTTDKHVPYGFIQHEGGPCGALAVVQAAVFRAAQQRSDFFSSFRDESIRKSLLVDALSSLLWSIGGGRSVTLVVGSLSSTPQHVDIDFTSLYTISISSKKRLVDAIYRYLSDFMSPKGLGALLFILSAVLSRGLSSIQSDMAFSQPLIVEYNYCSQELVNLLLTGEAVSHTHNGAKMLGKSGVNDKTFLRGISSPSSIGFVTLLEAMEYVSVGSYFKEPSFPVWVVFSESHYSVLFHPSSSLPFSLPPSSSSSPLSLFYYDQHANQDEEIHLRLSFHSSSQVLSPSDSSLLPPLNRVLWTLFPTAKIDWLTCDPLL